MKFAIVTAADENFLPAACALLVLLKPHLPKKGTTELWLIGQDLSPGAQEQADTYLKTAELDVQIAAVSQEQVNAVATKDGYNLASYGRLFIDHILEGRDYDRVLYLDADVMVVDDLTPLLMHDLGGCTAGAVHDYFMYAGEGHEWICAIAGLNGNGVYFNAGVMLFDWKRTLDDSILPQARMLVSMKGRDYIFPDQDALNAVLEGNWAPLDPRWNQVLYYMRSRGRHKPKIVHFLMQKPWQKEHPRCWDSYATIIERELNTSPWPDFVKKPGFYNRFKRLYSEASAQLRTEAIDILAGKLEMLNVPEHQLRDARLLRRGSRKIAEYAFDRMIEEAKSKGQLSYGPRDIFPGEGTYDLSGASLSNYTELGRNIDRAVYVNINAGLGNQLFHYATALALSRRLDVPMKIYWEGADTHVERVLELDFFLDDLQQMSAAEEEYWMGPRRHGMENKSTFKEIEMFRYHPELLELTAPCFVHGNWQNERHFRECRDELLTKLVQYDRLPAPYGKIADELRSRPSVCVHVRLTDFVKGPHTYLFGGVCTKAYYHAAMDEMRKRIPDCEFVLFSDDMDAALEFLDSPYPIQTDIGGDKSAPIELLLMTACQHNIIANSTFSWWGAWLNPKPNRIVIAPQNWLTEEGRGRYDQSGIYPKEWLTVPN